MTFEEALHTVRRRVETHLATELSRRSLGVLTEPMQYAVLNGGKRLRAFLVMESARLHSVDADHAVIAASAIEAIHAYSLVHDDLPAMDDDDLRRGKPTVHVKWDDATAILVGDALQTFAFELLSDGGIPKHSVQIDLIQSLALAAGGMGMVLGQALDIAAEAGGSDTVEAVSNIQSAKTGALIRWSAEAGARLAGADATALSLYANHLGLAFQIQDDVLDVVGSEVETGKRLQKDADAGKATFVSLFGLDGARARAAEEIDAACAALSGYSEADHLIALAKFVISRSK